MLSILCVILTIKVKVGIPESFKVGWYPPQKTGSSHLNKRPKFTFPQSKRFPPKHNLPDKENNSFEQAAFWHEIKVMCCLPIPLFYIGRITITVGRCTELEELFV